MEGGKILIELTLDNFEEIYRDYLIRVKHDRTIIGFSELCFINRVREGIVFYKGENVVTKIKWLKSTPEVERKIDRIEREIFEL